MRIDNQSPWYLPMAAVVGILVFSTVIYVQPKEMADRMFAGQNDFVQLYAGARLSGSEKLYSRPDVERVEREAAGVEGESLSHHSRLPFYSVFLRPLALLPYRAAYATFQAISLGSFLLFLWLFLPGCRALAAFASISIPLFANLQNGQDTTLVLLFAGLSVILVRKNQNFWAGLVLSLCAIKFHLFFLVPVVLLAQRRWRILYGGLVGGGVLIVLSFIGGGPAWPQAYLAALQDPDLHPHPEFMPNLHSLSVLLGKADLPVEVALGIAVAGAVLFLALRVDDYELALAFALMGSLLLSVHSYTQDCLVLLLSLAVLLQKPFSKTARELTELAASPIPYFCLLAGAPFNIAMPALLMAILGVAAAAARRAPLPRS